MSENRLNTAQFGYISGERRAEPRFKEHLRVVIRRPYFEDKLETSDISMGGFCVNDVHRFYKTSETINFEIMMAYPWRDPIRCDAKVASIYPQTKEAHTHRLNMQFLYMSEDDKKKLKSYLEDASLFPLP